jgi:hypothetical protein
MPVVHTMSNKNLFSALLTFRMRHRKDFSKTTDSARECFWHAFSTLHPNNLQDNEPHAFHARALTHTHFSFKILVEFILSNLSQPMQQGVSSRVKASVVVVVKAENFGCEIVAHLRVRMARNH